MLIMYVAKISSNDLARVNEEGYLDNSLFGRMRAKCQGERSETAKKQGNRDEKTRK